jgi:hypothetical protein
MAYEYAGCRLHTPRTGVEWISYYAFC